MGAMKAAVLCRPGNLEIREMERPPCPKDGVLVQVRACGVCAADVKMLSAGHRALVYPRILGHEIAGVVAQSRSPLFREGDRVQAAPGLSCGVCRHCRSHADNQCPSVQILGFNRDGGFSQYLALPLGGGGSVRAVLHPLAPTTPFDRAVFAEPLACCINAQNKLGLRPGDAVLIVGAGPLGLLHAALAAHKGVLRVLMADIDFKRRMRSEAMGIGSLLDARDPCFFEQVMAATSGQGVDALILAAGVGLDARFLDVMAAGGRISIFSGMGSNHSTAPLDLNWIHYREVIIAGAYGCTARQNAQALELIASGEVAVEKLITHRAPLDAIAEGFSHVREKMALKSIVEVENE